MVLVEPLRLDIYREAKREGRFLCVLSWRCAYLLLESGFCFLAPDILAREDYHHGKLSGGLESVLVCAVPVPPDFLLRLLFSTALSDSSVCHLLFRLQTTCVWQRKSTSGKQEVSVDGEI